jgi:hypothetical protein
MRIRLYPTAAVLVIAASVTSAASGLAARQITSGPAQHFFGYIGHVKNIPWSGDGRYIVALESPFQDRMPGPSDAARVLLMDTASDYAVRVLDETRAWNFQQGTMFYWNPDAPDRELFFNDRDVATNRIFTVRYDIVDGRRVQEYRFEDTPIANAGLAQTGGYFLAINYGRLARLRPVTGYPGAFDWTDGALHPADDGIFRVEIESGAKRLLVSYAQLADALRESRPDVMDKALFINHTLNNRDGSRIYFYARADFESPGRLDVPFTLEADGTGLTRHEQHIGGHPEWAEGHRIIGKRGKEQVIYDTDTKAVVEVIGSPEVFPDPGGDVALSPDGVWLANGSRSGNANSYVFFNRRTGEVRRAGPFPIDHWKSGELRIDAAPCWNRDSDQILFCAIADDATRSRQLFLLDLTGAVTP